MLKRKLRTYNFFFLFVWLSGSIMPLSAQKVCIEINNRSAKKQYEQAFDLMMQGREIEAYKMLEALVVLEPQFTEAWYLMADYNYHKGRELSKDSIFHKEVEDYFYTAFEYYEKVRILCPAYDDYGLYYFFGEYYYDLKEYSEAEDKLNTYISKAKLKNNLYHKAKEYVDNIHTYAWLINNPVPFLPEVIFGVSTINDEYLPVLSPDGELLFYTHRYHKKLNNYQTKQLVEEFTVSRRLNNPHHSKEAFSAGVAMPFPFNSQQRNEGAASITIDNRHMYITICETIRSSYTSYINCDIFESEFVQNKWTKLKNLGSGINGIDSWEGQPSITADGRVLFFASNRDGGVGGMDIYRSVKDSSGIWLPAENLGKEVNTELNEKSPFIHYDNQTLYFASDGWFGLGGFDIFFTHFSDSGWTKPKNMGYPLNTNQNEVGLTVSTNGKNIFFASNNLDGVGGYDIYSAKLFEFGRPKKVLLIKGILYDEAGNEINNAQVELTSIQTATKTFALMDSTSGKYAVSVPVQKNEKFIMTASKKGYFYATEYINPQLDIYEPPTNLHLKIKPIEKGVSYILQNVNFAFNSALLSDTSLVCIIQLVKFMNENPDLVIELHGHTDDIGDATLNMQLSENRAKAVRDFLIKNNISASRISYKGFGEKRPLVSGNSEEVRMQNRRVEFVVIRQ
jgi:outer membrane protein OmpA-like peptidoglycan-associated protein